MTILFLALLAASDAGAAAPLRPADTVLADYARAIGGAAAWNKHRTLHAKRDFEVKASGIHGTEERWATRDGKMLMLMTLPGVGEIRQGSNGKVQWSQDPINGLRILQGAEEEEARLDATWDADVRLRDMYQSARSVPPPTAPPAGKRWECVELTAKLAKPTTACFDAETHLRTYQQGTHASPQGDQPFKVTFAEWRGVDGVKLPWREEMTAGPVTLDANVTELKFDVKVDGKQFELPKHPAGGAAATAPAGK